MAKCIITGTIVDATDAPMAGVLVVAFPINAPQILTSDGKAVANSLIQTVTTSTGLFSLNLIRNITYCINIKEIGYKDTFMVPDQDTFVLWGGTSTPVVPGSDPSPEPGNW